MADRKEISTKNSKKSNSTRLTGNKTRQMEEDWDGLERSFLALKANVGTILRHTPVTLYPKAPLYNTIIIVDTVLRQKRNFKHEK